MTAVEELRIQGVRSFNPEQENIIKFRSPITIISGQNGAGKTTIIECLRFMATGEYPPKSVGGAFVTDPRLTGTTESKARVELQFRNYQGERIRAARLLQSNLKANGQMVFKSLDSIISLVDGEEKKSISSRCMNHEREMLRQLGVSKPVLSSVIFCHQEESNWPLAESKELKTRFDNIFEISRFTKALENLKRLKNEYQNKKSLIVNDLKYMGEKMKQVEEFKFEMASLEEASKVREMEVSDLGEEIETKEQELDSHSKILDDAQKREVDYKTKLNNMDNVEQNISSYAGKFSLIDPDQEVGVLSRLREEHMRRVREEERHHASRENEQREIERSKSQAESELKKSQQRLWSLEEKRKGVEKLRNGLKDLTGELSFLMSASGSPRLSSPGSLQRDAISRGKSHLHLLDSGIQSLESEQEAEVRALVSGKEDLVRDQAKREQTCKLREEERREAKRDLALIREDLGVCMELEDLQASIDLASDELASLKSSRDVAQIESDIKQLVARRQEQERHIPSLERESAELEREVSIRRTIESCKKDKQLKQAAIDEIRGRIEPDLESLFEWLPPQSELEEKLAKIKHEKEDERKSLSSKLDSLNKDLSGCCARKKMCEQKLVEQTETLRLFYSEMKEMCGGEGLTEVVERAKQECHSEQEKLTATSSSGPFYRMCQNFITEKNACPVCKRAFKDLELKKEVLESIQKRITMIVPKMVSENENRLDNLRYNLEKLQQFSGKSEEMIKIEKDTIPKLQTENEDLVIEERRLSQEVGQTEKRLKKSQNQLEKINALIPDVRVLKEKLRVCAEIDCKISDEKENLKNPIASKSFEEVKSQLQKAQRQVKLLDSQIEDKQSTKLAHHDQVRSKEQQIHELKTTQLEQQKLKQKQSTLLDKRVELEKKLHSLDTSIREVIQSISPIKTRILEFENQLREKHIQNESVLKVKRHEIDQFKSLVERINQRQKEVEAISSETSSSNLEACLNEVRLAEERLSSLNSKHEELRSDINKSSNEIINAKNINREFGDAIALRGHRETLEKLKQEVAELEKDVGSKQISKIRTSISQISALLKTRRSKRDKLSGELKEKRSSIDKLKRNLNSQAFRDIEDEYDLKKFEQRVVERIIKDFEYSYKTLDRCMMQFHQSKIDQINATLQYLWPSIYQGSDIDYIQISADSESKSSASGRCSYNYRVVMMKGDIELDMRGRCSAGQKVLACILIRLALAETFCGKCGIIALDEPTTNLDHKNMLSLATALVSLLEKKAQSGSNIQMILITHEQKFVEAFEHSESAEYYWELRKSGNFSKISKLPLSRSIY